LKNSNCGAAKEEGSHGDGGGSGGALGGTSESPWLTEKKLTKKRK